MSDRAARTVLTAGFAAFWLALAVAPTSRADWALENALVLGLAVVLVLLRRRVALSRTASACLVAFLCLHTVGAHYTYSLVPYDRWIELGLGSATSLAMERNHFDRLVHFAYGVLLLWPVREALTQTTGVRGGWSYALAATMMLSLSGLYEIVEWLAAVAFGGDLGIAYVGAQGDVWDAQKDMGLAASGLAVALSIAALRGAVRRRRSASAARRVALRGEEWRSAS